MKYAITANLRSEESITEAKVAAARAGVSLREWAGRVIEAALKISTSAPKERTRRGKR